MADLDENAQDSLLDAALNSTKDDDAVLGDISADPTVDDSLEDPVILDSLLLTFVCDTCFKPNLVYIFSMFPGPYLGFFVCGGKLGFREISDQYSYKKQPSKIRHYVRKKTFSFPGGGNCPLRPPAMYGPGFVWNEISVEHDN